MTNETIQTKDEIRQRVVDWLAAKTVELKDATEEFNKTASQVSLGYAIEWKSGQVVAAEWQTGFGKSWLAANDRLDITGSELIAMIQIELRREVLREAENQDNQSTSEIANALKRAVASMKARTLRDLDNLIWELALL